MRHASGQFQEESWTGPIVGRPNVGGGALGTLMDVLVQGAAQLLDVERPKLLQ